jgi:hypothetical protein
MTGVTENAARQNSDGKEELIAAVRDLIVAGKDCKVFSYEPQAQDAVSLFFRKLNRVEVTLDLVVIPRAH